MLVDACIHGGSTVYLRVMFLLSQSKILWKSYIGLSSRPCFPIPITSCAKLIFAKSVEQLQTFNAKQTVSDIIEFHRVCEYFSKQNNNNSSTTCKTFCYSPSSLTSAITHAYHHVVIKKHHHIRCKVSLREFFLKAQAAGWVELKKKKKKKDVRKYEKHLKTIYRDGEEK